MIQALGILVALLATVIGVFSLLAWWGGKLKERNYEHPVTDAERADLLQTRIDRLTAVSADDGPMMNEAERFEQVITARLEVAMKAAFEQGAANAQTGTLQPAATGRRTEPFRLPVEDDEPTKPISPFADGNDRFADLRDETGMVPASIAIARLLGEDVRRREVVIEPLPVLDLDDVSMRWLEMG